MRFFLQATWLQVLILEGRDPVSDEQVIPSRAIQRAAQGVAVMAGHGSHPELSPKVYGAGQWVYSYRGYEVQIIFAQL